MIANLSFRAKRGITAAPIGMSLSMKRGNLGGGRRAGMSLRQPSLRRGAQVEQQGEPSLVGEPQPGQSIVNHNEIEIVSHTQYQGLVNEEPSGVGVQCAAIILRDRR